MSTTKEVLERMYTAALAGDFEALSEVFDPKIVVEEPPFLSYGGVYEGWDAFVEVFGRAAKVIDLSAFEVRELTAEGSLGYAIVRVPLVANGAPKDLIEEWTVVDGRITHGRIFWFDPSLAPA